MKFEIGFNREYDKDHILKDLGCDIVFEADWSYLYLDIKDFDHLKEILDKVDKATGKFYSAVISFDPPTIYFDADV